MDKAKEALKKAFPGHPVEVYLDDDDVTETKLRVTFDTACSSQSKSRGNEFKNSYIKVQKKDSGYRVWSHFGMYRLIQNPEKGKTLAKMLDTLKAHHGIE